MLKAVTTHSIVIINNICDNLKHLTCTVQGLFLALRQTFVVCESDLGKWRGTGTQRKYKRVLDLPSLRSRQLQDGKIKAEQTIETLESDNVREVIHQEIQEHREDQELRARDATAMAQDLALRLEEEIVLGALHPRERLVEDELMARFEVKRHVVRQALGELEKQGLVQRKRNSGAQVKALTAKEVTDLYALREILETSCVRLIGFPVPDRDIAQLVTIQRTHLAAINKGDARAVFRANLAFHAAFFALCGNTALIEAIAEYARRTYPVRISTLVSKEYLERARNDHEQIIDALRNQDRKRLVSLCSRHLYPSRDTYLNNLKRYGREA